MKRADVVAGLVLAAGFGVALWEATSFQYRTEFAPGPGFAPVWISAIAIVIALIIALNALRGAARSDSGTAATAERVDKSGLVRVGSTLAGLVVMLLLVSWIGFVPAIFVFLVFLTLFVQRLGVASGVAVSAGTVAFVYVVFVHFLEVPIPKGPLGF